MLNGRRVAVILPAYNAAKTLEQTVAEIPKDIVDDLILTDDASSDATAEISRRLGIHTIIHGANRGYGGNQKTCYAQALARGADIIVMLHPDYQYSPRLVTAMASMIASGHYDVVLASRILGRGALKGGMPLYKYIANRALTFLENVLLGLKLSEYHTGYRAWSRKILETLPLDRCSDDFVFDNQTLALAHYENFAIGEISCPTRYFPEASSINFARSVTYGIGVLRTALAYRLTSWRLAKSPLFTPPNPEHPMPSPIAFLTTIAGQWTGTGINHESQPFTASLAITPINPTALKLTFTATAPTGELYHTETILISETTATSASNNLPGLATFTVTHPTPETLRLTLGDLTDTTTFRETITLHLTPPDTLTQTYSWAFPHTQLKPSSTATLAKSP